MRLVLFSLFLTWGCGTSNGEDSGQHTAVDVDGDGFASTSDCNDGDDGVHPDVDEVCDGIDNNCDGQVDEGVTDVYYIDVDGDGFGDPAGAIDACSPPSGHVPNGEDCDDVL